MTIAIAMHIVVIGLALLFVGGVALCMMGFLEKDKK
jgi:hypothetical protein